MSVLPPFNVVQGQPFAKTINWTRDGVAVDMTGWTGELRIVKKPQGDEVGTWAVDISTPGAILVEIADTSEFPALAKMGEYVTALWQIRLTEPGGEGQVFQGPVAVTGAL